MRKDYFRRKKQHDLTSSKIVQVNCDHVYIIGGDEYGPSLIVGKYDNPRSCLKIDLESGLLQKMKNMRHARDFGHSVILLGKQIYVVAGYYGQVVKKCETFDLTKAVWTEIPDFDEFGWGVTLIAIK